MSSAELRATETKSRWRYRWSGLWVAFGASSELRSEDLTIMGDTKEIVLRRGSSNKLLWDISKKFSRELCFDLAIHLFDGTDKDGYDFVRGQIGQGTVPDYGDIAFNVLRQWCMMKGDLARGRDLYDALKTIGMNDTALSFCKQLTGGRAVKVFSKVLPNIFSRDSIKE